MDRVGEKKKPTRFRKAKKKKKMAELTKAQLVEQMEEMKTADGIMNLVLDLSAEDTREFAFRLKTTQKGIRVNTALLYGVKN